jgi:hypothetical protein
MTSAYPRSRPTSEEVTAVKADGRQYGWLRSCLAGWPWPRQGISQCGQPSCAVCGETPFRCQELQPELISNGEKHDTCS